MKTVSRILCLAVLLGTVITSMWSQSTESSPADGPPSPASTFGLGMGIGYVSMQSNSSQTLIGWQSLAFTPDIAIGKFGLGIDIALRFRFNGGSDGQSFEIRPDDWVVSSFQNFLEVYLPKIQYIRYGTKGEPVYVLLGSIYGGRLGNGFIVNSYNNTLYQPGQRIFGASFDLDGAAFDFPYLGIETMVANLAAFDLLGGRFYVRPGAKSGTPVLENTQIGISFAMDTDPHYFSKDPAVKANTNKDLVTIWGIDMMQPVITGDAFTMNILADMAFQKTHIGGQLGVGGKIIAIFNYLAAIRYVGDNFIPSYFDSSYDLMREEKLQVYNASSIVSPAYAGWLVNLGFDILNNLLVFNLGMDGPFVVDPAVPNKNPNLQASLILKEGFLGGFSLQGIYDKHVIRSIGDIVNPTNAKISLIAGYKMGPAKISLIYDIRYDPYLMAAGNPQPWQVSSKLETTIDLF